VPLFSALEAEHCYLWWEILLVTDRDNAAIKDVFMFVEDECELQIRLLEDQTSAVALLGTVPAESFELFVLECEEHLEEIETEALALESDPGRGAAWTRFFVASTASGQRGSAVGRREGYHPYGGSSAAIAVARGARVESCSSVSRKSMERCRTRLSRHHSR
jgi:hypothetical protein